MTGLRHPELDADWWPPGAVPREVDGALLHATCGRGAWLVAQANPLTVRVGVDPVQQNLTAARERAALEDVRCGFAPATSWELPFADGCFARVVDSGGLQTAADPMAVLVELLRVLAHDGELVLTWGDGAGAESVQWPTRRGVTAHEVLGWAEELGAEVTQGGAHRGVAYAVVRRWG